MLTGTTLTFNATLAEQRRSEAEFNGVTQSPTRKALGTDISDATGQRNPFERAKVHIAYGYGLSGAGVKIGVVDTGYNLVGGQPAHVEEDGAGKIVVLASSNAFTSDAHGTHVASLAAGERDGTVMHGVAYNATLYLGMAQTSPVGIKGVFDEYLAQGVKVSSNSYGLDVQGNAASPWKPVKTSETGGFEVTAKNFLAYRDGAGLSNAAATANVLGGTAAEWTAAVASWRAFQNAGGVILFANSNYGANEIANGNPGLDEVDYAAAFPLAFTELKGGWITVTNATSKGLAIQSLGAETVAKSTKVEGNIYLMSAQCGLAASFCLSMDGFDVWSGSNKGTTSYESQGGTSQATPQTAGMIALLREAFPTASAADLAARLLYTADNGFFTGANRTVSNLSTASYTNGNGTITHQVSDIWGHGFPDMEKALKPVGATTTATARGRSVSLASLAQSVTLSRAFGGDSALSRATVLYNDQLNGVFGTSLGTMMADAPVTAIADAAVDQVRMDSTATAALGSVRLSFGQMIAPESPTRPSRVQSAIAISGKLGDRMGFAAGFGGRGVDTALGLRDDARAPSGISLADRALRVPLLTMNDTRQAYAVGGFRSGGLRLNGGAYSADDRDVRRVGRMPGDRGRSGGYLVDAGIDRIGGVLDLGLTIGTMDERGSFLGAFTPGESTGTRADSRFARVAIRAQLSPKVSVRGSWTGATTQARLSPDAVLGDLSLRSNAFAADVRFDEIVGRDSRLTLGVAQPLRIGGGSATMTLPTAVLISGPGNYSYLFDSSGYDLSPSGREIDVTAEFAKKLTGRLRFNISAMAISQPGHDADAGVGYAGLAGFRFGF
ncbi:MAG: S8 family peptidase [Pseudomonadota bacterium]